MPSPIGHSLAGLAIAEAGRTSQGAPFWRYALFFVVAANLPDIDFVPGLLVGHPTAFHRLATHSITAAVLFGAAVALARRLLRKPSWPGFRLAFVAYGSHILLDSMGADRSGDAGLQVLWPLSSRLFIMPWQVFRAIDLGTTSSGMIDALLAYPALLAIAWEFALLAPIVLALRLRNRWLAPPASPLYRPGPRGPADSST